MLFQTFEMKLSHKIWGTTIHVIKPYHLRAAAVTKS